MPDPGCGRQRPLSPHLQIYRLPLTAKMSILFRVAGVVLYLAMFAVVGLLAVLAGDGAAWSPVRDFLASLEGRGLLLLLVLTSYYHLCNGVRHLLWDTGRGLEKTSLGRSGAVVVAATVLLTSLTWWLAR